MQNKRRQKIVADFDTWVDDHKDIQPELLMDLQFEIFNMEEEIEFWIKYASRLKQELENYKSISSINLS